MRAVFVPKRYRISVETDSHLVERGIVEIEGHPGADAVMAGIRKHGDHQGETERGLSVRPLKDGKRKKHPEQQLTVRVTGDQTYKAVFKGAEPEVVIAADTWLGGTVTCNGIEVTPATDSFSLGQTLHFEGRAEEGVLLLGWYVNGIFTSLDMECDVVAKGLTGKSERGARSRRRSSLTRWSACLWQARPTAGRCGPAAFHRARRGGRAQGAGVAHERFCR